MRRLAIVLACSGALAGPLAAQRGAPAVPTHALARADARHDEPFTTVAGVRELSDGRLLVVDRGEKSIQLVDLAAGTASRLGHEGGGSGTVPVARDSGSVLRYDPRTKSVAAVARVGLPETKINASGSAGQRQVMVRSTPFAAQDDWTAGLDGRIAVVRHEPYRVEWIAPSGQRVTGPTVAYQPLKVTGKDREAWRERSQNPAGGIRIVVGGAPGGGSGSAAPAPMTTTARMAEPDAWPDVKPPFLANAAMVATDGRLWVQRTTAAGDDAPRFDLFDSFGKLVAHVTLPAAASRLVGFGRNSAYVVRKDENDLEYLERYRLP